MIIRALSKYSLGLNWNKISIVQYNPLWPIIYESESKRISDCLSPWIDKMEHVGSTAVPDLGSKPILDIVCAVSSFENIYRHICNLEEIGYDCFGECGRPGRYFFTFNRGDKTLFHLHLVSRGSWYWVDLVSFRDILRSDKDLAFDYYLHKLNLQSKYGHDRRKYREGKEQWFEKNFSNSGADGNEEQYLLSR